MSVEEARNFKEELLGRDIRQLGRMLGETIRAQEGDGFWVTGFEYLDQTRPEDVAKLDFDLRPLVGEHELSPAVNFHSLIYQRRPDVNAIVHVHSHFVSVLSSIEGQTVGMYNVVAVLFHEEQATYLASWNEGT